MNSDFGLRVSGHVDGNATAARVRWVLPGGPAQIAGLKVGDRILEWDGLPMSTVPLDDIAEFVEGTEGEAVSVVYSRYDIDNV